MYPALFDVWGIKFTEMGILKALREDRKHVLDNAFLVYVGLNTSWITFKMLQNIWYKKLQEMARIEVPGIIKRNGDKILNEMLHLRNTYPTI